MEREMALRCEQIYNPCSEAALSDRSWGSAWATLQFRHLRSTFLGGLGEEWRDDGLNLVAVALGTAQMAWRLVLLDVLDAVEDFAAFAATVFIGGHRGLLLGSHERKDGRCPPLTPNAYFSAPVCGWFSNKRS